MLEGKYIFKERLTPEDQDGYRMKDARVTTNFDRTKYQFQLYFFANHFFAVARRDKASTEHPDDPRVINKINVLDELESSNRNSQKSIRFR